MIVFNGAMDVNTASPTAASHVITVLGDGTIIRGPAGDLGRPESRV